ncbi:MAG: cupin domain-containing protein [Candidatus Nanopelagicales bacterium]
MLEYAKAQLAQARENESGRSAATVFRGDLLAQTVLALTEGSELAEHENPGEATLQVLIGRIRLTADGQAHEAGAGDLLTIPPLRHSVLALVDSAFLLTVARR